MTKKIEYREDCFETIRECIKGKMSLKASSLGFKCFYVKHESVKEPDNFIHCQASVEKGNKTNCNTCNLCDGSKADIVINAHGNTKNRVLVGV